MKKVLALLVALALCLSCTAVFAGGLCSQDQHS